MSNHKKKNMAVFLLVLVVNTPNRNRPTIPPEKDGIQFKQDTEYGIIFLAT